MKGKKIDTEFVNNFILNCLTNNKTSSEDILNFAQQEIVKIDDKIKEVEDLKKIRSKILDVIITFNKPEKNIYYCNILSLFNINNSHIAKFILNKIKIKKVLLEDLKESEYQYADIIFCIKQLLEHKVILNQDNFFIPGESFKDYLSFVLKEAET